MKTLVSAVVLLAGLRAADAQEVSDPRGYGELWTELGGGWKWKSGDTGLRGASSGTELRTGEWWFAVRGTYDDFLLESTDSGVRLFCIHWADDHMGKPPQTPPDLMTGVPLLATEMPLVRRPQGGWLASVPAEEQGFWVGVRCDGPTARVRVYGRQIVQPLEMWDRAADSVQNSVGAGSSWPQFGINPGRQFPGDGAPEFFRNQRTLLPWAPLKDTAIGRRVRAAHFLAGQWLARPVARPNGAVDLLSSPEGIEGEIKDPSGIRYRSAPKFQATVDGPCVLRVGMRAAWKKGEPTGNRMLGVRLSVGPSRYEQIAWAIVDLETSDLTRDQEVFLSAERQFRVFVPPGTHAFEAERVGPTWIAVERISPVGHISGKDAFSVLPSINPRTPEEFCAAAVASEMSGVYTIALDHYRQLARPKGPYAEWAAARGLTLALRLNRRDLEEPFRLALSETLAAPAPSDPIGGAARLEALLALMELASAHGDEASASAVADQVMENPYALPRDLAEALRWWSYRKDNFGRRVWVRSGTAPDNRSLREELNEPTLDRLRFAFADWIPVARMEEVPARTFLMPVGVSDEAALDILSGWLNREKAWYVAQPAAWRGTVEVPGVLETVAFPIPEVPKPMSVVLDGGPERRVWLPCGAEPVALGFSKAGQTISLGVEGQSVLALRSPAVRFGEVSKSVLSGIPAPWVRDQRLHALGASGKASFRTLAEKRPGIIRIAMGVTGEFRDLDEPMSVRIGGRPAPLRRLLWIIGPRDTPGWITEVRANGVMATTTQVVPPDVTAFDLEIPERKGLTWFTRVEELRGVGVPAELEAVAATRQPRTLSPTGLWEQLAVARNWDDDISKIRERTLKIQASPEGDFDALLERILYLVGLGRVDHARNDLLTLEQSLPEDSPQLQRVLTMLGTLSFETGHYRESRRFLDRVLASGAASDEIFALRGLLACILEETRNPWMPLTGGAASDLQALLAVSSGGEEGTPIRDAFLRLRARLILLRRNPSAEALDAFEKECSSLRDRSLDAAHRHRFEACERWLVELNCVRALLRAQQPIPYSLLHPFGVTRSQPPWEFAGTNPTVTLKARSGQAYGSFLKPGATLNLQLPDAGMYEIAWRSAHEVVDGVESAVAAPARIVIEGPQDSAQSLVVLASAPSLDLECLELPTLVVGVTETKLLFVPRGGSRVKVRVESGSGFLSLNRVVGSAFPWKPLGGLLNLASVLPRSDLSMKAGRELREDTNARLKAATAVRDPDPYEATDLADDLMYLAITAEEPDAPRKVLDAALLYYRSRPSGRGDRHWERHNSFASAFTRWRALDLSTKLPNFRQILMSNVPPTDPEDALIEALYYPSTQRETSLLLSTQVPAQVLFRSDRLQDLAVEIITAPVTFGASEQFRASLRIDGQLKKDIDLVPGKAQRVEIGAHQETLIELSLTSPVIRGIVRGRMTLLSRESSSAAWTPLKIDLPQKFHKIDPGLLNLETTGESLVKLENWPEPALKRPDDVSRPWTVIAPRLLKIATDVVHPSSSDASLKISDGGFVRAFLLSPDIQGIEQYCKARPKAPALSLQEGPPSQDLPWKPDQDLGTARETRGPDLAWELFASVGHLDPGTRNSFPLEDEGSVGLRVHWKPWEAPFYVRFSAGDILSLKLNDVYFGQLRIQQYFGERELFALRLVTNLYEQSLDQNMERNIASDLRARLKLEASDRLDVLVSTSVDLWMSTLHSAAALALTDTPDAHIFNAYRDSHRRWFAGELRARYKCLDEFWMEPWALFRTNSSLSPGDLDQVRFGVAAKLHSGDFYFELEYTYVDRFANRRPAASTENLVAASISLETWLGAPTWLRIEATGSYSLEFRTTEALLGVTLRFGGYGNRSDPVDPALVKFRAYQDSFYPW